MTKGLPTAIFEEFRSNLCVSKGDAVIARGCWKTCSGVNPTPCTRSVAASHCPRTGVLDSWVVSFCIAWVVRRGPRCMYFV
jgi:hypothetical protein